MKVFVVGIGVRKDVANDIIAMITDAFHIGENVDIISRFGFGAGFVVDAIDMVFPVLPAKDIELFFAFIHFKRRTPILVVVGVE
jgi:hypothetical protein